MFSIGANEEDTNMPRATVQRRGANNTAFFFVESRNLFAHDLHWKIHHTLVVVFVVLTLDHRDNAVRGHRTGSNNSGAEELPQEENK